MTRLAGKRLAGQTTTFDLVVLIQLAVVLQTTALAEGTANAVVFVVTVLAAHIGLARPVRAPFRPAPPHARRAAASRLAGAVIDRALRGGISREELEAAAQARLRVAGGGGAGRAGGDGHISAVARKSS